VLHSIYKVEAMRRTDEALNRTITQLMDAFAAQTGETGDCGAPVR
jgi:hypothetical protein